MVKKWMKQIKLLWISTKIDFDSIILNILNWNYEIYDCKKLLWYIDLYRVRIWDYRIIFRDDWNNISVLLAWKRWDVYKWLKNI